MMSTCFRCKHEIVRLGVQWTCEDHCRCVMAGCILDLQGADPEQNKARAQVYPIVVMQEVENAGTVRSMHTQALTVTHYDDRGWDGEHFGFVYFGDGSRLGYAHGHVWEPTSGNGGWGAVTAVHKVRAEQFLRAQNLNLINLAT